MTFRLSCDHPATYVITLQDHLDAGWESWFEGFSIEAHAGRVSVLRGRVADQAALHGLLAKIRDLGVPLLSVVYLEGDADACSTESFDTNQPRTVDCAHKNQEKES